MSKVRVVVDASFTLAAILPDESGPSALEAFREAVNSGAAAPSIWLLECANTLLVAERRKRIEPSERREAIRTLFDLPIQIEPMSRNAIAGGAQMLADTYSLTIYDAAYLDLAIRTGASLGTTDKRLIAAAKSTAVHLF